MEREVTLVNLVARPELNGQQGRLDGFDETDGRYAVRMIASGETLRARRINIEFALEAGDVVLVQRLVSRADLNGREATVQRQDKETGRWGVRTHTGELLALKRENLDPPHASLPSPSIPAAIDGSALDLRALSLWVPYVRVDHVNKHSALQTDFEFAMPPSARVAVALNPKAAEQLSRAQQMVYDLFHVLTNLEARGSHRCYLQPKDQLSGLAIDFGPLELRDSHSGVHALPRVLQCPHDVPHSDHGSHPHRPEGHPFPLIPVRFLWSTREELERCPVIVRELLYPDSLRAGGLAPPRQDPESIASAGMVHNVQAESLESVRCLHEHLLANRALLSPAYRSAFASATPLHRLHAGRTSCFEPSFLVPPAGVEDRKPPKPPSGSCAHCAAVANQDESSSRLRVCEGCKGELYCSRACQRAHWPAHKAQCKERSHEGREDVVGSEAVPCRPSASLLVPIVNPRIPFNYLIQMMSLSGVDSSKAKRVNGELPTNRYGSRAFTVKVQVPPPGAMTQVGSELLELVRCTVYDEARSVVAMVDLSERFCPGGDVLSELIRRTGVQKPGTGASKGYMSAWREGALLRLSTAGLLSPPNW